MNGGDAGYNAKARMVKHNKLAEELMWQKGIWNEHDDVSGKCYSCWGQPVGDKTVVGLVGERGTVVGVAAELHIVDICSFFCVKVICWDFLSEKQEVERRSSLLFAPASGCQPSHLELGLGQRSCNCPHPRSTWRVWINKIHSQRISCEILWPHLFGSPSPPLNLIPL